MTQALADVQANHFIADAASYYFALVNTSTLAEPPTGNGYQRISMGALTKSVGTLCGGPSVIVQNSNDDVFPVPSGPWSWNGIAIYNAASGGTLMDVIPVSAGSVDNGDPAPLIEAGDWRMGFRYTP